MTSTSDRFAKAIAAFDAYHQKDPNTETENGQVLPKELLYARRMTDRLLRFAGNADEVTKLAARCQHIGRWEIPRDEYPMDKKGYLQWRNAEKLHHARIAEGILLQCGYEGDVIEQVKVLIMKQQLHTNVDSQLLEDVACLVFIEYYLEDFAASHDDEKVVTILLKTMKKMTGSALKAVDEFMLAGRIKTLLERAGSLL